MYGPVLAINKAFIIIIKNTIVKSIIKINISTNKNIFERIFIIISTSMKDVF